jgi:hypothetical protein
MVFLLLVKIQLDNVLNLKNYVTSQTIVVTLNEIEDAINILFEFTHVTSNNTIMFTLHYTDDLSTNKKRYNEFDVLDNFFNKEVGQYKYKIINADSQNTLEIGAAILFGEPINIISEKTDIKIIM